MSARHLRDLVRAVLVAAAGAVVTLAQLNLPSRAVWENAPLPQYASVLVLAIFAVSEAVRSSVRAVQARKLRAYDQDVHACLSAGLVELDAETGASWSELGVTAYRISGFRGRGWLVPVGRLSLNGTTIGSTVRLRAGKGVAGTVFETQTGLAEDWGVLFTQAIAEGRTAWDARTPSARYGLAWGELARTEGSSGVAGVPIFDRDGRAVGVVKVEAPVAAQELSKPEAQMILRRVATAVADVGPPPTGWVGYYEP